jgi:AraC-like DNA-binding protein
MSERRKDNTGHTTTRDVNAAQRAIDAVKARTEGLSYDEVAKRCGYADRGAAHKAVQRELQRTVVTNVEELRRESLLTLEMLKEECVKRMRDKSYPKGMLFAVDRILAIEERKAKLMGLDIVTKDGVAANMVIIREVPQGLLPEAHV